MTEMGSANNVVTVEEVHETNSVGGIKHIWITAQRQSDESFAHHFRLNTSWIFPDQKLQLATVAPGDQVEVVWNYFMGDLGVSGDFTRIANALGHRQAVCQCLTPLVSDGNHLICPNKQCHLTLAARLTRLSELRFVSEKDESYWPKSFDHVNDFAASGYEYARPFASITLGQFWGQPGATLAHILENRLSQPVSLETFLIRHQFGEWILSTPYLNNRPRYIAVPLIDEFHGSMDELFQRRSTSLARQNLLMAEWIWALGLESLSRETIDRIVYHEKVYDQTLEPMLYYAYMLSHSSELVGEMGIDAYQARSIIREVAGRRVELFDVFKHYCTPMALADLTVCFESLG